MRVPRYPKITATFTGCRYQTNLNYTTMNTIPRGVFQDARGSIPERVCMRHKLRPCLLP